MSIMASQNSLYNNIMWINDYNNIDDIKIDVNNGITELPV